MSAFSQASDPGELIVRRDRPEDAGALSELAELDSARVPSGELLVAEWSDGLCAAVAIGDGSAIADPFRRTAEIVELLSLRARQMRGELPHRRRGGLRLHFRRPRPGPAQP